MLHHRPPHFSPAARSVAFASLVLVGSQCGARTSLAPLDISVDVLPDATAGGSPKTDGGSPRDSGRDAPDARDGTTGKDAPPPPPFDAGIDGACSSAVLVGSPLAMLGSCSTRDGRARIAGPLHPHITFMNQDPLDGEVLANASFVAADDSGGAYLVGNTLIDSNPTELFARVDGTGQVVWVTTVPASVVASVSPYLLAGGTLQVLAYAMTGSSIESFDTATGALTSTPLPAALTGAGIPAVGADGSLYVPVVSSAEVTLKTGTISRLLPDGTVAWTSQNLANFTASFGGFFTLALGPGDVSLVAEADTSGVASLVVALSASDGSILWNTSIPGQIVGGVAVAPDGSSAVIASNGARSSLSILERNGAIRSTFPVDADGIQAIGLNGDLFVGPNLVGPDGATKWTAAGELLSPTIDANGTVYELDGDDVRGLDLATGAERWSIATPKAVTELFYDAGVPFDLDGGDPFDLDAGDRHGDGGPQYCTSGAASAVLTSTGGVMVLTCSGGIFGASD